MHKQPIRTRAKLGHQDSAYGIGESRRFIDGTRIPAPPCPLMATLRERLYDVLVANRTRVLTLFQSWDEDKNGKVDRDEFRRAMSVLGYNAPEEAIGKLFDSWDTDGSGFLELDELSRILEDKLMVKPICQAAARQCEEARMQRPRSAAALQKYQEQLERGKRLMRSVESFNLKNRTAPTDPKDVGHQLTRLGQKAAVEHLIGATAATRDASAYARDYAKDGLEPTAVLHWANNERRLLSFVHYGMPSTGVIHTPLLHMFPSDGMGRYAGLIEYRKQQQKQQRGPLAAGSSLTALDVTKIEEEAAYPTYNVPKVAKGRWSQMRTQMRAEQVHGPLESSPPDGPRKTIAADQLQGRLRRPAMRPAPTLGTSKSVPALPWNLRKPPRLVVTPEMTTAASITTVLGTTALRTPPK